jgi:hypothetical protein
MAANQRRRQKQRERKSAKRKSRNKMLARQQPQGISDRLAMAASAPIGDCFAGDALWEGGLGGVLLSRHLPNGQIAVAVFLVDRYCLGVKDAFGKILTRPEYERMRDRYNEKWGIVELQPAAARKLVEGAVHYARSLGFSPHPDYRKAAPIFGAIDPDDCDEEFEYGMNGKPHFIAGPYDTPERCYRILSILEHQCGRDGFHFTVPFLEALPESLQDGVREISYEEDDDEDDDL